MPGTYKKLEELDQLIEGIETAMFTTAGPELSTRAVKSGSPAAADTPCALC